MAKRRMTQARRNQIAKWQRAGAGSRVKTKSVVILRGKNFQIAPRLKVGWTGGQWQTKWLYPQQPGRMRRG